MKILMIASELSPFVKTGGLANMLSSLGSAISSMGCDVRIVIPRYYRIDRKSLKAIPGVLVCNIGNEEYFTQVYETNIPNSKAIVYFIDYEKYFGRDGVYGNATEQEFQDNPARYSLLSHAALQVCLKQNWMPDIIHVHDWQACLAPVLIKYCPQYSKFAKVKTVLTIHNIGYQGVYSKEHYHNTGLDWNVFYASGFEDYDRINFLKAGVSSVDKITTVSPTYSEQIKTAEYGFGLEGLLQLRENDLIGILNGIDTKVWNPKTDNLIACKYAKTSITKKAKNKEALQEKMGLSVDKDVPIFGMVTRLSEQKGINELFAPNYGAIYHIAKDMKVQFAIIGEGDSWCERELVNLAHSLPNLRVFIGYDETLSHLLQAGSDFFLMPSKYEPCGLSQMYAMRYGTIPIVRRTGGLADTVENYNEKTGDGTGFMLEYLSPNSIYDTVGWACYAWYNKKAHIKKMRERGMDKNFGISSSASQYVELYEGIVINI